MTGSSRPRTSVLINNYNNAPFLGHCLDSVLYQEVPPDEVIVFDDGSTDQSREILSSYGNRVTLLLRDHGAGSPLENQARAIFEAFKVCTGELVFLLDGDDAFLPDKVANFLKAYASAENVVMIQSPLQKIDEGDRVIGFEYERNRHQEDYLSHIYSENELNIYYPTSALAFSRAYLQQRLPLDYSDRRHIWADARLALVAPHFGKVVTLSKPYTQWRRHSASHTVRKSFSVYELVRMNQAYFNEFCRNTERPVVQPWKSFHHRRRWFRHYFVPEFFIHWYRALRWATLSEDKRLKMLSGPDPKEIIRELERFERQKLAPLDSEKSGIA